jgi:hypothetical protein
MALITLVSDLAFGFVQILEFTQFKLPTDAFFERFYIYASLASFLCIGSFVVLVRYSIGTAQRVVATTLGLYLATLAVATGGDYFPHHFLFAIPVYVACFASLIVRGSTRQSQGLTISILGIVSCLLVLNSLDVAHRYNLPEMQTAVADVGPDQQSKMIAHKLDALLTSCGDARYFFTGGSVPFQALMLHSPYQLAYGLQRADFQRSVYFTDGQPNPYLHAKLVHDFAETRILVLDAQSAAGFPFPDLQQHFLTAFSSEPPACARPYIPIPGISIFFRH